MRRDPAEKFQPLAHRERPAFGHAPEGPGKKSHPFKIKGQKIVSQKLDQEGSKFDIQRCAFMLRIQVPETVQGRHQPIPVSIIAIKASTQPVITLMKLFLRHQFRDKITIRGTVPLRLRPIQAQETALRFKPLDQGCVGKRHKRSAGRERDPELLQEIESFLEDVFVVRIEPYDHPGHHRQVIRMDALDIFQDIFTRVLNLAGFHKARLPRRFDPDKKRVKIRSLE